MAYSVLTVAYFGLLRRSRIIADESYCVIRLNPELCRMTTQVKIREDISSGMQKEIGALVQT